MNNKQKLVIAIMVLLVLFAIGTTPAYKKEADMSFAAPYPLFLRYIFLKSALVVFIGSIFLYVWRVKRK